MSAALAESGQEAALTGDILRTKALERLVESANAVDANGSPVDLTPIVPDLDEAETAGGEDDESDSVEEEIGDSGQEPMSPETAEESGPGEEHEE